MRKILNLIISVAMILSMNIIVAASNNTENNFMKEDTYNYVIEKYNIKPTKNITKDNHVKESIIIKDKKIIDDLIDKNKISIPENTEKSKIKEIEIINTTSIESEDIIKSPRGYRIENVVKDQDVWHHTEPLRESIYSNPGGTMTISEGVYAEWSANVGVSAEIVSTGVGFTVGVNYTVSDSQTVDTQGYDYAKVTAYDRMWKYNYDVVGTFLDPDGTGDAYKPFGVRFEIVRYNK